MSQPVIESSRLTWYDAADLLIEGRGWQDEKHPYHRLPARAQAMLRPELWQRSLSPAGLSVRFRSDASDLHVRWSTGPRGDTVPDMPPTIRNAGLDGYGYDHAHRQWRWVGAAQPAASNEHAGKLNQASLDGERRDYRIYLPLGMPLQFLHLGVPREATLEHVTPDPRPPVVVYGTSIVQGAGVSRPGLAWPSIVSRRLDYPFINLGFSSHGTMDAEVGRLMAELDAALFVIDCLPNMNPEGVRQRLPVLLCTLRTAHPSAPILLVGDRLFGDGAFIPARRHKQRDNTVAQREVFEAIRGRGDQHLHLLDARNFFGDDFEGSTDTVHPNDIGAMRIAETMRDAIHLHLNMRA